MKRILSLMMAALLVISLAGCSNQPQAETEETQSGAKVQEASAESVKTEESESAPAEAAAESEAAEESETAEDSSLSSETGSDDTSSAAQEEAAHSEVLVAYFSATGTTKGVAERIAAVTGGDLYEIVPAEPYSDADLDWNDKSSRSTKEQDDKNARPAIGSEDISLEGYTTIYLGFPIWWGEEPRILDTFVEKYSFEGITVIPFCTSGGSGIGRSGPNMEELAGNGTWLEGERFSAGVSEEDLQAWIEGLQ